MFIVNIIQIEIQAELILHLLPVVGLDKNHNFKMLKIKQKYN
jgi:hypothetical protein